MANRYNNDDRDDIITPIEPSWCFEEENGAGEEDERVNSTGFMKQKKKRRKIIKKIDANFVVITPLVTIAQSPIREEVQEVCQKICGWERYLVHKCNS